jgi:hypothetical protein
LPGRYLPAARCGGGGRWEIPPGRTATSDPVPLAIAAGDDLVVSCLVSGDAEPAAYLHSAQRTGEVLPGAERFTSLYWITRVLTDVPAADPVVVALGDPIIRGGGTSADRGQRYADHPQRRLLAAGIEGAAVLNAGIGGNRLLGPLVRADYDVAVRPRRARHTGGHPCPDHGRDQ